MIGNRSAYMIKLALVCALVCATLLSGTRPAAALANWPLVKIGQNGPNVTAVQYLLRHRGYTLTVDGAFGSGTESVVKQFQSANGLTADGVVGANTWAKLVVTLDPGANNNAVRALQTQLAKHGYSIAVDGAWGAATTGAVNDFKADHYLGGGSTVGATTWQELTGAGNGGASGGYSLPVARSLLPRGEYDDPHHDYPAIDLPVSSGTPIYAVSGGTATRINDSSCGLGYSVAGNDGASYAYCHFSGYAAAGNATVSAGQLLGYSGNTGNSTGPHLHLGIKYGGLRRCPQTLLLAIYDGVAVPAPSTLPTSGCSY
ncbi:MAG TPA: peptidoglycan-binding protein [Herpetosiphonaceae bacterium]|nr:peptidoglycan-binding protein [Herpetosiphonaceae bacterium]